MSSLIEEGMRFSLSRSANAIQMPHDLAGQAGLLDQLPQRCVSSALVGLDTPTWKNGIPPPFLGASDDE